MDELTIIMTSVNYSDYLQVALPEAVKYGRVVVATCPGDGRTVDVARACGAEYLKTREWSKLQFPFCKGAGINAAIAYAKPQGWLLLLDSDTVLMPPPLDFTPLNHLDDTCLYGVRRRVCPTERRWKACVARQTWYDLPLDPLPVVRQHGQVMKVWGSRPTANPIGLEGYFQLWYYPSRPCKVPERQSAAKYDVELGLRWGDDKRVLLPWRDYAVLHLGPTGQNWQGRKTARWTTVPLLAGKLELAADRYYG